MRIIVDYRERPSGIVKELVKHDLEVDVMQLSVADFILKTKNSEGNLETVGIEKKTQSDFLSSIADKRIVKQLVDLKREFTLPILIIEGFDNMYALRNFHPNAIRGMLASIAVDLQVPIIYTRNVRDTAAFIATVAKRLEKPHRDISLVHNRRAMSLTDQQEIVLESLPGVGRTLAKSLLQYFGSVRSVVLASVEDLQKVEKIGKKKAQAIRDVLDKSYQKES